PSATRGRGTVRSNPDAAERMPKPPPEEPELLQLLLAEPTLVPQAQGEIEPEQPGHPGLRLLLSGLYALATEGAAPTLDNVRSRIHNPRLIDWALNAQNIGRQNPDRNGWLQRLLSVFRDRRVRSQRQELQDQLHAASDHGEALELLRRLQNQYRED